MIKKLFKMGLFLLLLSFTPFPAILFAGSLFFYKDGFYVVGLKNQLNDIWNEMIQKYDLYYINEMLDHLLHLFVFSLVFITLLIILMKFKKKFRNKGLKSA